MKAIPISILVLVAFPIHLVAQEANDFKPQQTNYYSKRYFEVESPAKHIVDASKQSNRKGASAFKEPVIAASFPTSKLQLAPVTQVSANEIGGGEFKGGSFSALQVKPLATSPSFGSARVAAAPEPLVPFEPIRLQQDGAIQITSPDVDPGLGVAPGEIVRPTPSNSNSRLLDEVDSQPSVSDAAVVEVPSPPMQPQQPQRDTTYGQSGMGQSLMVEPEAVSLDQLRMSQQEGNWDRNGGRPNTMRHITDHFSPGGEPFARRGSMGDPNFFGVDRRTCCDEWGFCNCSGGLKKNPGHLGIPWLKNCKEACDTVNPIRGRCKAKRPGSCGCSQCVSSDCGCGQ